MVKMRGGEFHAFPPVLLLLSFVARTMSPTTAHQFQSVIASAGNPPAYRIISYERSTDEESKVGQKQPHARRKHARQSAVTQTFTGTVEWEYKPLAWDCDVPNCDHFALYDDATQTNYELDDARAALPYEGKRARVNSQHEGKHDPCSLYRRGEMKSRSK